MNFLAADIDTLFVAEQIIPARFEHLLISNDEQRYLSGPSGDIISQAIVSDECRIWQHHFLIAEPVLLHPYTDRTIYTLNYMLKGTIPCEISGMGKIDIKEGAYNLYCIPPVHQKAWFSPGMYRCIHIDLPLRFIEELAFDFGTLQDLLENKDTESVAATRYRSLAIDNDIQILLQDILQNKQNGVVKKYFLEARIRDLILLFVRDMTNLKNEIFYVDKAMMETVRTYISDQIHNPLTIDMLAKKFGINRLSLSRHFKNAFGISLHQYLIECRMKKALLLLSEKSPIHEIATLTGYPDTSSFTRAFSTYYGKSPSAYRKDMENNSL